MNQHEATGDQGENLKLKEGLWHKVFQFVAISAISGLVGFGTSEMLAVDKLKETVHTHTMRIDQIRESLSGEIHDRAASIADVKSEIQTGDLASMKRIDRIADMVEQLVKQNTELITLIRVQNQMGGK